MNPAKDSFERMRLALHGILILLLLLVLILGGLPAFAKVSITPSSSGDPIGEIPGLSMPGAAGSSTSSVDEGVPADVLINETQAAMIAAENAALTPGYFPVVLPVLMR